MRGFKNFIFFQSGFENCTSLLGAINIRIERENEHEENAKIAPHFTATKITWQSLKKSISSETT